MSFDPMAIKDEIETALEDVGLYLDRMHILSPVEEDDTVDEHRHGAPGRSHVLMMECLIGDVAFTSRVQDAAQHSFDEEFSALTREITSGEYDDIRRQLGGEA